MQFRTKDLPDAMAALDALSSQLIWQTNRIHSQSQSLEGFTSVTGSVSVLDAAAVLSDAETTGLEFLPEHGSFQVHLTETSTGQRTSATINIDLDGINPAGDATLNDVIAQLDGVAGISASLTPDGRVRIDADAANTSVSFSEDSSGFLAALGINTFFTGSDAYDMAVATTVANNPAAIAAARDHLAGDNQGALLMAQLRETPNDVLNGQSLAGYWNQHIEDFAVRTAQAKEQEQSTAVVKQSLAAQQQSISGVNADEETIDLIRFQRAYQASARFISVIDEMMQTLLQLV
jgi:flagellar hook-associated protein 1 FlgK